jgi:hypothetical protein
MSNQIALENQSGRGQSANNRSAGVLSGNALAQSNRAQSAKDRAGSRGQQVGEYFNEPTSRMVAIHIIHSTSLTPSFGSQ